MDEKPLFWLFRKEIFLISSIVWAVVLANLLAISWPRGQSKGRVPSSIEVKLNLNQASIAELTVLPGVGRRRAEQIVRFRQERGPFRSIYQLKEIEGISDSVAEKISDLVRLQ